jgi:hypothetical protein
MIFCGQCGYKLAPGNTRCPRCGSVTEADIAAEDPHLNDPTMVVLPTLNAGPMTPEPETHLPANYSALPTPSQQPKLVLRPNNSSPGFGAQAANDPTRQVMPQTPLSPANPSGRASYPGYSPQSSGNYTPPSTSYPGFLPATEQVYPQVPGHSGGATPLPAVTQRSRGRGVGLVAGLLVLLILGSVAVFVVRPSFLKGLLGNNVATPTAGITPAATLTATDHARTLIQQYYANINSKHYQDAYNMWGADFQNSNPYDGFVSGYSHTLRDDVTINQLTTNTNGTVTANITIVALEDTNAGQVTSTYQGTYILGQENGTWKFLRGTFNKVS